MEELLGLIIPLVFVAVLLAIGMFVGGWAERSHLRSLEEREQGNSDFLITQVKSFPGASSEGPPPAMLVGEAVIASDYLKSFLGKLRNIFGGEVRSYQTLMDRARREALQRIVEQARTGGYNALCNVRLENADVGGNSVAYGKRKPVVMAAILASGTAYHRQG